MRAMQAQDDTHSISRSMKASGLGEATVLGTVDPSGTEVGAGATEVAEVEAEGQEAVRLLGRKVGGTEVRAEAEAEAEAKVAASQSRRGRPAANSLRQILGGHSAHTSLHQGQRQHLAVWRLAPRSVAAGAGAGAGAARYRLGWKKTVLLPLGTPRCNTGDRSRGSHQRNRAARLRRVSSTKTRSWRCSCSNSLTRRMRRLQRPRQRGPLEQLRLGGAKGQVRAEAVGAVGSATWRQRCSPLGLRLQPRSAQT